MNDDESQQRITTRLSDSRPGLRAEPDSIALLEGRWQAFWQDHRQPAKAPFAQVLALNKQSMSAQNEFSPKERPPKPSNLSFRTKLLSKRWMIFKG